MLMPWMGDFGSRRVHFQSFLAPCYVAKALVLELEYTRFSIFQLGLFFDLQGGVLFSEEGFKLFDFYFTRIHCVEEDGAGGPRQHADAG
jgi:hypothetical protein